MSTDAGTASSHTVRLRHGRLTLALHRLSHGGERAGERHPLLLLHGLGERSPAEVPEPYGTWPGAVWALDFTGHGESDQPKGGGYTCETLMADADAALANIGTATVVGRGLGAYVGLLLAGGRPDLVRGLVVHDGPGMAGGGPTASSPTIDVIDPNTEAPPDPWAIIELARDVRPPDYAAVFARIVLDRSSADPPIWVSAHGRPPWLAAVVNEAGVAIGSLDAALAAYAR